MRAQLVDEAVVEVEARLIHASASAREDARPRDREPERVEPELAHERDVVAIAVVEVAREVPGVAVSHLPRRRAEAIPNALTAAFIVRRALDLVRGGGGAPQKVVREGARVGRHRGPFRWLTGRSHGSARTAPAGLRRAAASRVSRRRSRA